MIAENLKALRVALGLTQQQIAEALDIERSTYAYYEIGKSAPDIKTIAKLLKIFNITYDDLLHNRKERTIESYSSSYVTLHDSANNSYVPFGIDKINNLSKDEQQLIIVYRILDNADRKSLLSEAFNKLQEKNKKI